jgi:superfamily II DNA or RNA helicase
MEGEKDPLLSWWKSIQSLTAYIVVLNATPSEAHQVNYYNNYEVLDFDDESKDWKHPWLETPVKLVSVQSKAQKKKIIEDNVMEFVVHQMEHNQLLDYLEEVCPMMNDLWSKLRLQTAMIKLDRESKDSKGKVKKNTKALSVNEAKHLLEDLNEELKETKIKIYDYVQEKYIEKEYDTDLICPVIKDQKNNTSLDRINNAKYKDNILLVCELGTYGINIPSLSMLIGVRDTYRHLGKEYTITQLLGRLARNVLVDNYFLCDKIVSSNPDMKHFPLVKRALMNVTKKSAILFSSVTINDNALEAFADKLPNEQGMSDKIDKILLDDFGWIPQDKNMMNSSGSDIERSYEDRRTDKCSVCDNAMFDLHENKLIDDGHSLVEARFLSIKQFMHNGHTHTRDDETQRSICYSCHMIETMDHKHYLSSDHPDRTTAK